MREVSIISIRFSALHTFWKDVDQKDNALNILQTAKKEVWKNQNQKYQERLSAMARMNKLELQQFEDIIAFTADSRNGEDYRAQVFEGRLKELTNYSSFHDFKGGTAGYIRSMTDSLKSATTLEEATEKINNMKQALETTYIKLWQLCSNTELIGSYVNFAAAKLFDDIAGETLQQAEQMLKVSMNSGGKNSEEAYKKLIRNLISDFGKRDNVIISGDFIKEGKGLSILLNQMFNKIQGAIETLNKIIDSGQSFNDIDIIRTMGYAVTDMLQKSEGYVLEAFETQLFKDKTLDYQQIEKFNKNFAKLTGPGVSVKIISSSEGQSSVQTTSTKKTSSTADISLTYQWNPKNGTGSVNVVIPISVKGYRLKEESAEQKIHILNSGGGRNFESLIDNLNSNKQNIKKLAYHIFGTRAGKEEKSIGEIEYDENALQREVYAIKSLAAYTLLVDSLSGRAAGGDISKNAVIFDLNGHFFTISNLLERLDPDYKGNKEKLDLGLDRGQDSISISRKNELDPGLGNPADKNEIKKKKIERYQNVQRMFMTAKINVSLRHLGL